MDFGYLYASTKGRISRKTWWLGFVGLLIIALIVNLVASMIGAVIGLAETSFGIGLLTLITLAILFIPYQALTLKRLHDTGRPETLFWIFIAPSILSGLFMMLGVTGSMQETELFGQVVPAYKPNAFGTLFSFVQIGVGLWSLYELGIRKGMTGDNAHGPDPLAPRGASAPPAA